MKVVAVTATPDTALAMFLECTTSAHVWFSTDR